MSCNIIPRPGYDITPILLGNAFPRVVPDISPDYEDFLVKIVLVACKRMTSLFCIRYQWGDDMRHIFNTMSDAEVKHYFAPMTDADLELASADRSKFD